MAVLERQVNKIRAYLASRHSSRTPTRIAVCKETLFSMDELNDVLGTAKLPNLKIEHVARFIVLHT